jgi:tRNA-dihydrouridine synthase 4
VFLGNKHFFLLLTDFNFFRPLVVQFAANSDKEFGDAAELIAHSADGVDLNCGCPQKWAMQEGVGAALLKRPEQVREMVRQARERARIPVSVKIRVATDVRETVELVRIAEQVGAAWITVHGRTADSRPSDPVDFDKIRLIKVFPRAERPPGLRCGAWAVPGWKDAGARGGGSF